MTLKLKSSGVVMGGGPKVLRFLPFDFKINPYVVSSTYSDDFVSLLVHFSGDLYGAFSAHQNGKVSLIMLNAALTNFTFSGIYEHTRPKSLDDVRRVLDLPFVKEYECSLGHYTVIE